MIEENLKKIILERYGSMIAFSKKIDMANSTLATILDRGINKASISNVIKICNELDISADGLAYGKIVPRVKKKQKSVMNIEEIIEDTQNLILDNENISINGKPMTSEEREDIADAIGLCFDIVKVRNKRGKRLENTILQERR